MLNKKKRYEYLKISNLKITNFFKNGEITKVKVSAMIFGGNYQSEVSKQKKTEAILGSK